MFSRSQLVSRAQMRGKKTARYALKLYITSKIGPHAPCAGADKGFRESTSSNRPIGPTIDDGKHELELSPSSGHLKNTRAPEGTRRRLMRTVGGEIESNRLWAILTLRAARLLPLRRQLFEEDNLVTNQAPRKRVLPDTATRCGSFACFGDS